MSSPASSKAVVDVRFEFDFSVTLPRMTVVITDCGDCIYNWYWPHGQRTIFELIQLVRDRAQSKLSESEAQEQAAPDSEDDWPSLATR